jgi:hypothetical protein
MCGILGVINGEKGWHGLANLNDYMKQGAITGIFRGEDSTGMMQVGKNGAVKILKATVDGYYFAQQKNVIKALNAVNENVLSVIHHRAATRGSISYANTHPFDHEMPDGRYVVGVHNGTINQFKRTEDGVNFDVDSDWLYYRIAKHGGPAALSEIGENGAYALVWYEQKEKKVFIAANTQRPIHWAQVKGKNVLLVASEAEMLYWLARRNSMELEKVLYPPKNSIWEFDPAGDLTAPIKHDIEVKKHVVVPQQVVHGHTREVKDRTGKDQIVNDSHGPVALSGSRFSHLEEVEFVYSHHEPAGRWTQDTNSNVFGEIISATTDVAEAVISGVLSVTVENIARAEKILVKVVGIRTVTDKDTGEVTKRVMCTTPFHMSMKEDTAQVKEESEDSAPFENSSEDLVDIPTVVGPRGRPISVVKYMQLTKDGCALCQCDLRLKHASSILWVADRDPLCESCGKDYALAGTV